MRLLEEAFCLLLPGGEEEKLGESKGDTSVGSIKAFGMFTESDRCEEEDVRRKMWRERGIGIWPFLGALLLIWEDHGEIFY